MSEFGVHDFEIPHEFAQPVRDMVVIRIPLPPKQVGSILMPDMARDIMQHNVAAGRVVAMGPLAFTYKDVDGLKRHDVKKGDWVVIRPFAGTLLQAGKGLGSYGGYRYVSSFQDVISILPADKMPDPAVLRWSDNDSEPATQPAAATQSDPFADGVRERVVYKPQE